MTVKNRCSNKTTAVTITETLTPAELGLRLRASGEAWTLRNSGDALSACGAISGL